MQKVKFKQRLFENRFVLIAFLASAVILLITYIHLHIFPFGDRTILRVDLFHQYAPYLEEMRSRVANGQSLFYSWEGGLGKDFLAQTAYYTTSPLNLLYFWFPAAALPEAVAPRSRIILRSISERTIRVYCSSDFCTVFLPM